MKVIGGLLILVGMAGLTAGMAMFGDIGIAAIIGSIVGILSGIGFLRFKSVVLKIIKKNAAAELTRTE